MRCESMRASADCFSLVSKPSARPRSKQPLNVVFVTLADLPEGGGSTSRLKMLARATVECGHDVTLLNQHALGVTPAGDLKSFGRIGAVEYKYILAGGWRKRLLGS